MYTVKAVQAVSSKKRQSATVVSEQFPANVNSGTLTTLQEGVTYEVTVTASTTEGQGEVGDSMTVAPFSEGEHINCDKGSTILSQSVKNDGCFPPFQHQLHSYMHQICHPHLQAFRPSPLSWELVCFCCSLCQLVSTSFL